MPARCHFHLFFSAEFACGTNFVDLYDNGVLWPKSDKKLFTFDQIWFYEAQVGANIHTARSKINPTVAIFKVK